MSGERQLNPALRIRRQRNSRTEKDRDDTDFNCIHESVFGETAEERSTTEQP